MSETQTSVLRRFWEKKKNAAKKWRNPPLPHSICLVTKSALPCHGQELGVRLPALDSLDPSLTVIFSKSLSLTVSVSSFVKWG
jgi:hypothetical protein